MNLTSQEIVRQSGSNLAFALAVLPREKRYDMGVFYAFCRVIDDIADVPGFSCLERIEKLGHWSTLINNPKDGDPQEGVECEFVELIDRYSLNTETLNEIITGVEMDLEPQHYETKEDLKKYCYHVAGAVGLISIEIFGYKNPKTIDYAKKLGYALQWTNIMRDVGEDAAEGRIYLPLDDLEQFGVSPESLLEKNVDPKKFRELMEYEAGIACGFFQDATETLPGEDRKSMRSAELMARIYSAILELMEKDGFQVFEKRYRLSKARMLGEFLRAKYL